MATINLSNGLPGQDFTAAMVSAEEPGSEFLAKLEACWPDVVEAMSEDARSFVRYYLGEVPAQQFLAAYLAQHVATDVVL